MSEADAIRREYEESLSWRLTRPLRSAKRVLGGGPGGAVAAPDAPSDSYDGWLDALADDRLREIDAACAQAAARRDPGHPHDPAYALFRELDADLWGLLLTGQQDALPGIRALLPDVPPPALQEMWNGAHGARLAAQSAAFYARVCDRWATHGDRPLEEARVLDHGCGWGRLLRFFARDVAPGALFGVDPTPAILDVCRRDRVPAELHGIPFLPEGLPVRDLDLAYAFSVFTHVSERAAEHALDALHGALRPGGLLVATVRPPDYLALTDLMPRAREDLGPQWRQRLREPRFVFEPHPADDVHPQYDGGAMTYGEAIITLPWVRDRWAPRFRLLDASPLLGDLHQVVLVLRRD